jgi:putative chitinase
MLAFLDPQETADLLRAVAPACKQPDEWAPHLSTAMHRFGISNDLQFVAAFVAQLMVESQELNRVAENLNYSAERLCAVWPKRFPTIDIARRYAHQPRELANYVYANRFGNGPPESDDGFRFRGRGALQTTFRANYQKLQDVLGIPCVEHPELLEEKGSGSMAAAWYWWERRLSFLAADLPTDDDEADFLTITRRINGGTHGLAARKSYWRKAQLHFGLITEETHS